LDTYLRLVELEVVFWPATLRYLLVNDGHHLRAGPQPEGTERAMIGRMKDARLYHMLQRIFHYMEPNEDQASHWWEKEGGRNVLSGMRVIAGVEVLHEVSHGHIVPRYFTGTDPRVFKGEV